MHPSAIAGTLMFGIVLWLVLLFLLIAYRLLVGSIEFGGLLAARGSGIEAERVLQLVSALFAIAGYAVTALNANGANPALTRLPEAPPELLALFGATSGTYIAGKIFRTLRDT